MNEQFKKMEDKHPKDTGCAEATAVLFYQSICTECPFFPMKCVHEGKQPNRTHERILKLSSYPINKIAREVGVTPRTVYRVLREGK